jgi:hypothetical protein
MEAYELLRDGHYWWLTYVVGMGGNEDSATLLPIDSFLLDRKLDDSLPLTGNVVAAGDNNVDPYGPELPHEDTGPVNDACVTNHTSPPTYNVQNPNRTSLNMCSLLIRSSAF